MDDIDERTALRDNTPASMQVSVDRYAVRADAKLDQINERLLALDAFVRGDAAPARLPTGSRTALPLLARARMASKRAWRSCRAWFAVAARR